VASIYVRSIVGVRKCPALGGYADAVASLLFALVFVPLPNCFLLVQLLLFLRLLLALLVILVCVEILPLPPCLLLVMRRPFQGLLHTLLFHLVIALLLLPPRLRLSLLLLSFLQLLVIVVAATAAASVCTCQAIWPQNRWCVFCQMAISGVNREA
jgi:hypothetical protein